MHVILGLTKGHFSNKDTIAWQKGCPNIHVIRGGDYCTFIGASRPDGIPYGFADFFFVCSSATLSACLVAICYEENNGLG